MVRVDSFIGRKSPELTSIGPAYGTREMTAMTDPDKSQSNQTPTEFESAADEQPMSLPAEFWLFIREEKKWWLTPIILMLLLLGALAFLGGTGAAPFIYSLF